MPHHGGVLRWLEVEAPMKASHARDELKHIRLIHFSLALLSGTLLYLVITAWSEAPQLYGEIRRLQSFLGRLGKEGVPLKEINPDARPPKPDILDQLDKLMARSSQGDDRIRLRWADNAELPAFPVKFQTDAPKPQSLSEQIDAVTNKSLGFLVPDVAPDVLEDDHKTIEKWWDQLKGTRFTPSVVGFTIAPGAKEGEGNKCTVTLSVLLRTLDPMDRSVRSEQATEAFDIKVKLRQESASVPDDWLKQEFPLVEKYRGTLGARSPEEVLAWTAEQRTKRIESLKPTVFEVEVRPAHVGVVGPLVIATALLYLLSNVSHLIGLTKEEATRDDESVGYFSPWMGATQNWLALTLAGATLVLLPSVAMFFSLWRLAGWAAIWAVAGGVLLGLVPGGLIAWTSARLAKRKVVTDAIKDSDEGEL